MVISKLDITSHIIIIILRFYISDVKVGGVQIQDIEYKLTVLVALKRVPTSFLAIQYSKL